MPICNLCTRDLPEVLFLPAGRPPKYKSVTLQATCSICRKREDKYRAKARRRSNTSVPLRELVIKHYGGKCTCCHENNPKFLTIEHMNGGGNEERRKYNGDTICRRIINANFPPEYSVLCMNCNWAKGRYGECPHKEAL